MPDTIVLRFDDDEAHRLILAVAVTPNGCEITVGTMSLAVADLVPDAEQVWEDACTRIVQLLAEHATGHPVAVVGEHEMN